MQIHLDPASQCIFDTSCSVLDDSKDEADDNVAMSAGEQQQAANRLVLSAAKATPRHAILDEGVVLVVLLVVGKACTVAVRHNSPIPSHHPPQLSGVLLCLVLFWVFFLLFFLADKHVYSQLW